MKTPIAQEKNTNVVFVDKNQFYYKELEITSFMSKIVLIIQKIFILQYIKYVYTIYNQVK